MITTIARRLGLALAVTLAAGAAAAQSTDYDGDWEGVLTAGGPPLHLVLHIKTAKGVTAALLDSVDQGASVPATAVTTDGGQLDILFVPIKGELKSKMSDDGKTLTGVWTQGVDMPLTLTRQPAAAPAH
jgi:hypothetical protein